MSMQAQFAYGFNRRVREFIIVQTVNEYTTDNKLLDDVSICYNNIIEICEWNKTLLELKSKIQKQTKRIALEDWFKNRYFN